MSASSSPTAEGAEKIAALGSFAELKLIVSTDGEGDPETAFWPMIAAAGTGFSAVDTACDDPCLMIYTSGTTGQPKGTLHGHRVLIGHLPGFQFSHQPFDAPDDLFWTPADWAWAGGLLNVLLPALFFGKPVLAAATRKFDPEAAFALLERHAVSHAFVPPTALRMMRAVDAPRSRYRLVLKRVASAGEALGAETYHWAQTTLGLSVDEFYGQTECNYVLGSSKARGRVESGRHRQGSAGGRCAGAERRWGRLRRWRARADRD